MNRTQRATLTVGDVMTAIPQAITADETVALAWSLMQELGVRHLPVTNARGELIGIVSERDLRVAKAMSEDLSKRTAVEEIMMTSSYVVSPSTPLSVVARTMASRKRGSAIVADQSQILGIFTTTDALRTLADAVEGKSPRVQAFIDMESRPTRPKTRRPIRGIAAS